MKKALDKLFVWTVDHPIWTLGITLLVAAGLTIAISGLKTETDWREFVDKDDPIIKLMDEAEERYGRTMGIFVMVVNDEGIFNKETLSKIRQMEEGFEAIPGVKSVSSPLSSQVITGTETALNVQKAAPKARSRRHRRRWTRSASGSWQAACCETTSFPPTGRPVRSRLN